MIWDTLTRQATILPQCLRVDDAVYASLKHDLIAVLAQYAIICT